MEQEILINNISKQYGDKEVLNDINLSLTNGIYGLIGPNGAGKSTLMSIMTTLLKQTNGSIHYNGKDISILKDKYYTKIGMMPQSQKGYDNFTALQFLYYMATLKGMDKKQATTVINELLIKVGLENEKNKKLKAYSGGMLQRLMFVQAILSDPSILVLDEPTAGLDPAERIRLRNLIAEIAKDKIVIIATHVMQDIESIAKELVLLKDGKIIFKCTTDEIIHTLDGKVFEKYIKIDELDNYKERYKISRVSRLDDKLLIRYIINEVSDNSLNASMEDVYLYYM